MLEFILFATFLTFGLVGYSIVPAVYSKAMMFQDKRQQKLSSTMESVMSRQEAKKLSQLFVLAPFAFMAGAYFFSPEKLRYAGVIIGLTLGILFPTIYINMKSRKTRDKFHNQLIDALMIMSSSFRGGLSLVQALEAVVEEMPDPIRKEFEIVLGENKMGVSLEEALYHLYNRMPSTAMQQMITAILLARETGGNLPAIFNRIVNNIRETKKIQQNLDTLTIQGKLQGGIMSLLPVMFGFVIYSANRRVFENFIESDTGRTMFIIAVVLQIIGAFLVIKISTLKEF